MRFRRLHAHVFGVLRDRSARAAARSGARLRLERVGQEHLPQRARDHPLRLRSRGPRCASARAVGRRRARRPQAGSGARARRGRDAARRARAPGARPTARRRGRRRLRGDAPGEPAARLRERDPARGLPHRLLARARAARGARAGTRRRTSTICCSRRPRRSALRPVGELLGELRKAHQALWRPTRDGNPAAKRACRGARRAPRDEARGGPEERGLRDARARAGPAGGAARASSDARRRRARPRSRGGSLPGPISSTGSAAAARSVAPIDLSPLGELALADPAALASEIEELRRAAGSPTRGCARGRKRSARTSARCSRRAPTSTWRARRRRELRGEAKQCAERPRDTRSRCARARRELAGVLARDRPARPSSRRRARSRSRRCARLTRTGSPRPSARGSPPGRTFRPGRCSRSARASRSPRSLRCSRRGSATSCAASRSAPWPWPRSWLHGLARALCGGAPRSQRRRSSPDGSPISRRRPSCSRAPRRSARFLERIAAARTTLANAARGETARRGAGGEPVASEPAAVAELCHRLGLRRKGTRIRCAARLAAALAPGRQARATGRAGPRGAARRAGATRCNPPRSRARRGSPRARRDGAASGRASAPTLAHALARVEGAPRGGGVPAPPRSRAAARPALRSLRARPPRGARA